MILGIDEVGRGPWAGPLVVGAVVLGGAEIIGLTDSKKLTKKRREELDIVIRQQASAVALGWVSAQEIDDIGLSAALILATKRAVEQINTAYHEIIIDGTINFLQDTTKGEYVKTMKKADLLIPAVSAASIVAKVARDEYMSQQDKVYPGYGFKSHVGYGTAVHAAAIAALGVTPLHRLSFAPLAHYRKGITTTSKRDYRGLSFAGVPKTTKQVGDGAEDVAAAYLRTQGHTIIERNWRTKVCEIDIVSQKDSVLYFVEVKYRRLSQQGGGMAAITPKKLKQMKFAVEIYLTNKRIRDMQPRLAAMALTGVPAAVEHYLEIL